MYLETARRLKAQQDKKGDQASPEAQQLDFEFVLFASAVIDYDYIMGLIARYTREPQGKQTMNRSELAGLIAADAKFINERENITAYIATLKVGEALSKIEIKKGYEDFKAAKNAGELAAIAAKHGVSLAGLQAFVGLTLQRLIFDGDQLSELMAPLNLGWKARIQKELALMEDLAPRLRYLAEGHDISGLSAYE